MRSRWRTHAAVVIARALEETKGQEERDVRRALKDAYPFGERSHYPYRVWCEEVRRARGSLFTMTAASKAKKRAGAREGASLTLPEAL